MNRFQKFILLLQTAVIITDTKSGHFKGIEALNAVFDPNVEALINLDVNVPVIQKVKEYMDFVYFGLPKPFWFVLETESSAPDKKDPA